MISIVIPSHESKYLDRLLKSIPNGYEVIIVDDKEGKGAGWARNDGARRAKGDTLLFVDSDVILNKDTLFRIEDSMKYYQTCCCEYDIEPANPGFFTDFKAILARSWIPSLLHITAFTGRCGAITKELFDKVGGFTEHYESASVEEWDLGRKITKLGMRLHYDPTITVKHHFPDFPQQIKRLYQRTRDWMNIHKKYGKFDNTCTTKWNALTQIIGFLTVVTFPFSLFYGFGMIAFPLGLLVCIMNWRFLSLSIERKGIFVTLLYINLLYIVACAVTLGGISGKIKR